MRADNSNKIKLVMPFLAVFLVLALGVDAFTTNGTGKIFDFAITLGKNADISSSSFRTYSVIGDIISTINSSNFKTEVGFLRTLPYLNGEPCQVNLECAGGFCCSNLCKSSACPSEEAAPSAAAAAAAGGGGAALKIESFSIDKELIKALIKQGSTYKTKFTIKNDGTEELSFNVDYSELEDFLLLSDTKFALAPDESKDIDVTIFASETQKPDVYTGNIRVKAGSIEKALPVIIEVQAKKALFDISVNVIPQSKNILKTEKVIANITLINVGDLKPIDAQLYYAIRDIEGNDLIFGIETLAVYNAVSRIKELELPPNISVGTYIFYGKVSYGIETAAAGDVFYVVSGKPTCFDGRKNQDEIDADCGGVCKPCKISIFKPVSLFLINYKFIIFSIILIIIAIILFFIFKRKRGEEIKKEREEEITNKLINYVNLTLSKGYKAEQIRAWLLSKGVSEKIVDIAFDMVLSDKFREAEQERVELKITIPLNKEVIDYIEKALNLGHQITEIKKALLKAGWQEHEIEKHLSEAIKKRKWVIRQIKKDTPKKDKQKAWSR